MDEKITPTVMLRRGVVGHLGEGNDAYPIMVAVLDDQTRVIEDGIQWIVQRWAGRNDPAQIWRGTSFCRTKAALLRCSGHPDHPALATLPERLS